MELTVLLPILAFVALAAGLIVVFRRTNRIVARTRQLEEFRVAIHDLAARIDLSLEGATGRIDSVRHHMLPADALGETMAAATDAVERYIEEAKALIAPSQARSIRSDIVADLERAGRALAMVEHGASIMINVRRGNRELEGQTSLKRGYLNLLHAREAIARHAAMAHEIESRPTDSQDILRRSA